MITQNQRATFQTRGLIHLPKFLPEDRIARGRDSIVRALEPQGLWQDGIWHLDQLSQPMVSKQASRLIKGVSKANTLRDVVTADVCEAITELVDGRSVSPTLDRPQLLFTFPNATSWYVPHDVWHLDWPRLPNAGIPGVQMFTFLDTVEPGGGGTLVVTGSHRLLNTGEQIRSKDVKRRLKRDPYFHDLMSKDIILDRNRFISEPSCVGDVELQVVELYGQAGDVYLMDLRLLHTIAPNASRVPRMMLIQRFVLEAE